jgi:sec-independent protein translocase protein TatA
MDLGVPELVVVLVIVLVLFGPGKLPQAGAALGHAIREFRENISGGEAPGKPAEVGDQGHSNS